MLGRIEAFLSVPDHSWLRSGFLATVGMTIFVSCAGATTAVLLGGIEDSVGGFGSGGGACARDFAVGFGASVAIKLPGVADFLDVIEIEFGNEEFVFVAARLRDDFSARIAEIALSVEFADFPGSFCANAINGCDEVLIGDGVSRLLEFPEIFGEPCDGGGGIVDNFRAVQAEDSRAFGEMAVVADVNADAGVARLEDGIAGITRSEIELFPKAWMAMRNVVLAIFAEVAAVGVDHRGRIEIKPGHFDLVNGNHEDHLMFFRELLHVRDSGAVGDGLGEFVPTSLLLGAKIGAVEKFLESEDLNFFLCCGGDEVVMLRHHFLFDLRERILLRRPFTTGLDQTAADNTGHDHLPTSFMQEMLAKVYPVAGKLTRITGSKVRRACALACFHTLRVRIEFSRDWVHSFDRRLLS